MLDIDGEVVTHPVSLPTPVCPVCALSVAVYLVPSDRIKAKCGCETDHIPELRRDDALFKIWKLDLDGITWKFRLDKSTNRFERFHSSDESSYH